MRPRFETLLWIDCLGGLVVGCVVLAFVRTLSAWDNLPASVLVAMGLANLAYGSFSVFVATRTRRSQRVVGTLAMANMSWLAVCVGIAATHRNAITTFGLLHVIGEGVYVAALGYTEWTWRAKLAHRPSDSEPSR